MNKFTLQNILRKLINSPFESIYLIKSIFVGSMYIAWYKFKNNNISIQFPFKVSAPVRIVGPGKVIIGKNCTVQLSVFKGLSIVTFNKNSKVVIGDGCHLEGLTIRCKDKITIGANFMSAASLIQDSHFIYDKDTYCYKNNMPQPTIYIKENLWISSSIILKGSSVGNNCVIAAGSVLFNYDMKDNTIGNGNIIKRSIDINKLLKIMK